MSGKQTYQLEERIKRYLQDQMTGQERHAFEREMQHDQFLAEAVEGYLGISAELVGTDLADLKKRINKRQKGNRKYIWYAAASVIILVVSSLILFNPKENSKQMVSENKIQQKIVPAKEIVIKKQEIDLPEPAAIKKLLPEKNMPIPEDLMIVAESEAMVKSEAPTKTGNASASVVHEQPKMKETIQLPGNNGLAKATITLPDSSAIAFNQVDESKKPIRIRGVRSLNNNVTITPGVEIKKQAVNEEADKVMVASNNEIQEEKALDEVVVVGYGTQKKVSITGAVAGVNVNQNVDENASPAIGWIAFNKYLKTALLAPSIGSPEKKTVVRLSFVITKTGTLEQIKVLSSKDERYNEVAIHILKAGPGWKPEVMGQSPRSSVVKLRMVFESSDKKVVKKP
ncbi:MAG: hypothetical protein NTY07_15215 [Bacteroidia bacterium]|nr:hypothetical protein [Bacteroidia bacterium]